LPLERRDFTTTHAHTEQEQQTARVPVIAVTAFARGEDRQSALAAGFDEPLPSQWIRIN